MIVNFLIPGEPRYNQVMYFARKPSRESANPPSETYERMLDHFLKGPNDKFRDKRFKLIPSVEALANAHAHAHTHTLARTRARTHTRMVS